VKTAVLAVAILCSIGLLAQAPRTTYKRNMVWGLASVDYKFNAHWSASLDNQFRYEYTDGDIFMWLIRPSVSYKFKSGLALTAGSAYFSLYPNPNGKVPRPEFRHWQEIGWKFESPTKTHTLYPRLRFEERVIREYAGEVLAEDFTLNCVRVRARIDYTYKFHADQPTGLLLFAGNETFFLRKPDGYTAYDQNRAWIGVGYRFSKQFTVQASYLNWYQQRTSSVFDQFHVIRLALQFQLERKPKTK